ncbi:MAG: hypothetical protein IPH16_04340 [Haliscomenobacter sp.]|nr:hypothetical protein [Haliscomenobacter sp.]
MRNLHILPTFILMVIGILFTTIGYGQSKTDAGLYAMWKDKSKPDGDRIKAYFDRLNDWEMFEDGAKFDNKWFVASDKAIELALKLDKKEYLPLFYLASSFNYAMIQSDFEGACSALNKVIESAKVANASKIPVFMAYEILSTNCEKDIKEDIIINEFNKLKSTLPDSPEGIKALRNITNGLGMLFTQKDQYPKALTYLQESQHLSEDLNLTDAIHAQNNAILSLFILILEITKRRKNTLKKACRLGIK